jgi:Cu2+-exporting ATPase
MRLLDNAVQARSRYVQLADRASRLYAPVVHATALLTILGWVLFGASWHDAIVTGVAVLIITCPCALGLAIPTVQTVASGAMFRAGVLLNSGDSIERLAEVDHIIFDKTGTLTLPDLEVVNASGIPEDVFKLAGQLALASHHPVAAALARAANAKRRWLAPSKPGQGVRADLGGKELRFGRPSFCGAEQLADDSQNLDPEASIVAFSDGKRNMCFVSGRAASRCPGDDFSAEKTQPQGRNSLGRSGAGGSGGGAGAGDQRLAGGRHPGRQDRAH